MLRLLRLLRPPAAALVAACMTSDKPQTSDEMNL